MILLLYSPQSPRAQGSANSITTSLEITVVRESAAQVFDGE